VRIPLARTDALITYPAAIEAHGKLKPLRRRLTSTPDFPSAGA